MLGRCPGPCSLQKQLRGSFGRWGEALQVQLRGSFGRWDEALEVQLWGSFGRWDEALEVQLWGCFGRWGEALEVQLASQEAPLTPPSILVGQMTSRKLRQLIADAASTSRQHAVHNIEASPISFTCKGLAGRANCICQVWAHQIRHSILARPDGMNACQWAAQPRA